MYRTEKGRDGLSAYAEAFASERLDMKITNRVISLLLGISAAALPLFGTCAYAYEDGSNVHIVSAAGTPEVSAASAILINADTGSVLYEKNAYEQRAMASTTKIMTALLTAEAGDLDRKFTADSYAINVEGTSMGLREGDIVTRRALLYGMLLPSGNDAANAAAVSVSGSMQAFAELMNKKAGELGLKNTHFVNPSGLDADGHYTTAYDLARLTAAALSNPVFADICKCADARVEFGNPPYLRSLANSNKLLWQYDGCIGVKTGFTDNARRCLVSAAERDGVRLIAVTLNAPDDWNDHRAMLDYGFTQVKPTEIVLPAPIAVPVVGGCEQSVRLELAEKITMPLSKQELENVTLEIHCEPFLYAGIEKGTAVGTARVYMNGEFVRKVNLVTVRDAEAEKAELGFFEKIWGMIRRFFG